MTHPQQQLIDKWREIASAIKAKYGTVDSEEARLMRGRAYDITVCADELTAALRGSAGLVERIDNYLQAGGLVNPEMMEHDKVRSLLLDCRDTFTAGLSGESRCTCIPVTAAGVMVKNRNCQMHGTPPFKVTVVDARRCRHGHDHATPQGAAGCRVAEDMLTNGDQS